MTPGASDAWLPCNLPNGAAPGEVSSIAMAGASSQQKKATCLCWSQAGMSAYDHERSWLGLNELLDLSAPEVVVVDRKSNQDNNKSTDTDGGNFFLGPAS